MSGRKFKKMTLAQFQNYEKLQPKYVISFRARDGRRLYVANGFRLAGVRFVSDEKDACFFQNSKEAVAIFASSTAGNHSTISLAKECFTAAHKDLIDNQCFKDEIMIVRQNKKRFSTYFCGGHIFE